MILYYTSQVVFLDAFQPDKKKSRVVVGSEGNPMLVCRQVGMFVCMEVAIICTYINKQAHTANAFTNAYLTCKWM